nr:hypothetical protein [Ktedonobacter robiniae]
MLQERTNADHHQTAHLRQAHRPDAHDLAGQQLEWGRGIRQNFHNATAFLFRDPTRHDIGIDRDRDNDHDRTDKGEDISCDDLTFLASVSTC